MLVTIVVFLLVLSILVLVHELGHFLVAKKLGVKVEEFGFGFPPRVFSKKIGETLYSINLLPIGGFVKLYGEDDAGGGKIGQVKNISKTKGNNQRAFFVRPVWQRAAIVVAGVVMNFLLAVIIISYLFSVQGVDTQGKNVLVLALVHNAPAEKAGLKIGDTILTLNGQNVISTNQVITTTKKLLGHPIILQVKRKDSTISTITLTPRITYPSNQGPMGVAIGNNIINKKYPWYQAPFIGTVESIKESWLIVQGLWTTVMQLAIDRKVPQGVAGPIGIAQLTGQFVQIGFNAVLSLLSLLSLNLAILNILPIPALDGGRLFFILIEAVTGKKVNRNFEAYAHNIGMILLLGLIALITAHDIIRIISGQPLIPKM